jgi:hypothetical protein
MATWQAMAGEPDPALSRSGCGRWGIAPGRDRGDAVVVGRIRPMAAHCAAGAAWANRQVPAIWQHAPLQTTYLWLRPSVPAALI